MNERIKELMDQAGIDVEAVENLGEMPTALKFAELIVRECLNILDDEDTGDVYGKSVRLAMIRIKQHFGVEE